MGDVASCRKCEVVESKKIRILEDLKALVEKKIDELNSELQDLKTQLHRMEHEVSNAKKEYLKYECSKVCLTICLLYILD